LTGTRRWCSGPWVDAAVRLVERHAAHTRQAKAHLFEVLRGGNVGAAEHLARRRGDDLHIEPEAPVVNVRDVEAEPFLELERMSPAHRRPARDARTHVVPALLLGGVRGEVFDQKGTGAHQAHLAAKDVPQLGQLVDAG